MSPVPTAKRPRPGNWNHHALWRRYAHPIHINIADEAHHERNAHDQDSATWLLRRHLPLILRLAARGTLLAGCAPEEAAQAAHLSAWLAIASWAKSAHNGTKLATFIGNRIKWDFLRNPEELIHVPAIYHSKVRRVRTLLARVPFPRACAIANIAPATAHNALCALEAASHGLPEMADEGDPFGQMEAELFLDQILQHVNEKQRAVLFLRAHGLTLEQIAGIARLSRERIRQIELSGIKRIRRAEEKAERGRGPGSVREGRYGEGFLTRK